MPHSESNDRTISPVKRGHLTSVICGQPTSVLTSVPFRLIGQRVEAQRRGDTVHIFHRDREVAAHPVLPGRHQFRILPEHGPGASARIARQRRSTLSELATHPGALPEVEVRDLACYEVLCGSAAAHEVQP